MVRVAVIAFLLSLAYFVFKALWGMMVLSSRKTADRMEGPQSKGEMVQDPACGLYIPRASAVSGRVRGEDRHFCSADCLEKYRKAES